MRSETVKSIKGLSEKNINLALYGERGVGKTFLLKSLNGLYFPSPNLSREDLKRITNKNGTVNEQIKRTLETQRKILLIDNIHEIKNSKKTLINEVSRVHTIIGAGLFVPRDFEHWHQLKIEKPSFSDCIEIIKEFKIEEHKKKEIIKQAKQNPSQMIHMARMQEALGYYKLQKDEKKTHLKVSQFTNYLLSLRYFFMFTRQWQLYSLISMIAYAIIGFSRRKRYY